MKSWMEARPLREDRFKSRHRVERARRKCHLIKSMFHGDMIGSDLMQTTFRIPHNASSFITKTAGCQSVNVRRVDSFS